MGFVPKNVNTTSGAEAQKSKGDLFMKVFSPTPLFSFVEACQKISTTTISISRLNTLLCLHR